MAEGRPMATGKLRVAVATSFPTDPDSPKGGVEAVSLNLCLALSKLKDLDIHVVTFVPGKGGEEVREWGGMTVHRLPALNGYVLLNAVGKGRRRISQHLMNIAPDVIHAHDTYGLMVLDLPLPRVFTIHGFIHGDTLVSGERFARMRSWIWKRVETRGWSQQPHIVSISPYVRERLSGIAKGIIHDIDNPISEDFFHIKRRERKGVIFSAAVISPRKNTLSLVEGFAMMLEKGYAGELHLAGAIWESRYGQLLMERIASLGLEKKVLLLGSITAERVREELAEASIFALVSLEENSPMGIEEAMAAGVPVVTSNRCGMPYMVRHGESGYLVDPSDPADISMRLAQILEDDSLRENMGKRSIEIAMDRFHPQVVARRTREVYYEAARSG